MTLTVGVILFLVAALGGAMNAVVGGATFVIFPALVFAGVPPIQANATSSVVVWPPGLANVFAYRRDIDVPRRVLVALGSVSFAGGAIGAWLLLRTPGGAFVKLVPWLLLFATLVFTFAEALNAKLGRGLAMFRATARHWLAWRPRSSSFPSTAASLARAWVS